MLNGFKSDAGMTPCQIFDPQRHDAANDLLIQRVADTGRMTHEDIFLKLAGVFF